MHFKVPFRTPGRITNETKYSILPQHTDLELSTSHDKPLLTRPNYFAYIRRVCYALTIALFILSFFYTPKFLASSTQTDQPSSTHTDQPVIESPTINLVIADRSSSPSEKLTNAWSDIPELSVIHYDFPSPGSNRDEAETYLNYIYEFYDSLPEISIFTHTSTESNPSKYFPFTFNSSAPLSISNIDLAAVQSRGFLPFSFQDSSSINTSYTTLWQSFSFKRNFPHVPMPSHFTSHCSEFAVSRSAIRSIPREQYLHHLQLLETASPMSGAGKKWEYMWQWLFLGHTEEVIPFKNLCDGWKVCFASVGEWDEWTGLVEDREQRRAEIESEAILMHAAALDLSAGIEELQAEVARLSVLIEEGWLQAVDAGRNPWFRNMVTKDLFTYDVNLGTGLELV